MGLDMYAFATTEETPAVDCSEPGDAERIFYWRKHPDLHGWMEQLYRSKGGSDPDFNLSAVRLDLDDIDALEKAVRMRQLPKTAGFFFGESCPEHADDDIAFIKIARAEISKGKKIVYQAWW